MPAHVLEIIFLFYFSYSSEPFSLLNHAFCWACYISPKVCHVRYASVVVRTLLCASSRGVLLVSF